MAGISSKAAGKLRSNKGFNGNELQSKEFSDGSGLELYDFNARTYDPQIGRFMQIDPETELWQENLTPYHFGLNNPILHDDPDGKNPIVIYRALKLIYEVTVWAQKQGRAVHASMALKNVSDNTVIAKPIMSLKELAESKVVVKSEGISEQSNVPNPDGAKGKQDHQDKVKELTDKARGEAKEGEKVVSEKKIQGHDSNRRPDAQIVDKDGKTRKVFEAERRPNSQRNIKRENEYKKLGVEQETHKVGAKTN